MNSEKLLQGFRFFGRVTGNGWRADWGQGNEGSVFMFFHFLINKPL
jgi:hypothetical protein